MFITAAKKKGPRGTASFAEADFLHLFMCDFGILILNKACLRVYWIICDLVETYDASDTRTICHNRCATSNERLDGHIHVHP